MKKQNSLFAFALLFSLWGLGQTAMAQKARKEVSRAQAKTLMLKQQKATPSDLKRFRDEPIPGGMARIILEAHDVWGDGSGYQMLLDADHTAYGNEIPLTTPLGNTLTVDCDIPATLYAPFEFKVPADADPSCTPEHQVVDGVACIDLPAGVYDYVVVNPTPSLCIVIPGIFGQEDDTFGDDFRFEAGKIYHFLVAFHDGGTFSTTGDYVTLTVTDGTPLHPVQNLKGTAEGQKVTLKWDSPTSGKSTIVLNESFDKENLPEGWSMIDADGDGHNWMSTIGVYNTLPHSGAGAMFSKSWTSKPDLTPDNYLVTPRFTVPIHGELTYWVSTQEEWVNENYGVFLSVSGNQVANFTEKLFEENLSNGKPFTMRQKRENAPKLPAPYRKRSIDLSAYAGQEVYLAFRHFNSEGVFRFYLDDVTVSDGEVSEEFTYTVYRDGTKIKEGLTATLFEENGVSVGTHEYCVEVQYVGGVSPKECVDITVSSQSLNPVTGLTATQDGMDAVLRWGAPVAKDEVVLLSESFDTGKMPEGWTTIDSDGDGHAWDPAFLFDFGGQGHNGSIGLISSASYIYYVGILTPDNYLISPELSLINGGTLSFWVCAQDIGHPAEHYAVYASTGGNAVEDFTILLLEETIENKTVQSMRKSSELRSQTPWKEKTVTLPVGTKYVAFRHFDCSDMYRLCIDDVEVSCKEDEIPYTYTIYRNGTEIASVVTETTYRDMNLVPDTYTYGVKVVYPNGESSVEEATLTITSLSETVTTRPYTLAVHENQITVTCKGEVRIYDINGRLVATGIDVVKYTTQNGVYVIRIIVNGKTYVEKVIL
ncbi:DUF2436 domain-containing protein [Bacteroides heparinolyticus]|uniref:DUF2436 domain-containing protein n=1 Tax=Prevotella heparinolytica TaxID=28113 RepID=A0A3P2A9C7_9BACE|nr:choice-of-anchor J domain-containing protein [Bacteroides heparinolyticus]RRD92007.1 DUF2436 domain-containing protein [Bacteroides heparinolyticus]